MSFIEYFVIYFIVVVNMEKDYVLRICNLINYPWISRTDRSIYEKYPQLDPVGMARKCFFMGLIGYGVARFMRYNRVLVTFGGIMPFAVKFIVD